MAITQMKYLRDSTERNAHLILTYDYELYLGSDSGSFENCLQHPTNLILEWLEENHAKAIFFIDTVYLMKLRELAGYSTPAATDWKSACQQILRMGECGHDIFPHIHAHWIDAEYDEQTNRWSNDQYRYYRFAACPQELCSRLYDDSVNILREILGVSNHVPEGYRAGGWSIQPFDAFRENFEHFGTFADFSVVPDKILRTGSASYDFSGAPEKPSYRFSDDPVKEDPNGRFVEIPISTILMSMFEEHLSRIFGKVLCRTGYGKSMGQGIGVNFVSDPQTLKFEKETEMEKEMATLDGYSFNIFKIPAYMRHVKQCGVLHMCSHPKLMTRHSLTAATLLLKFLKSKYHLNYDFRALVPAASSDQ